MLQEAVEHDLSLVVPVCEALEKPPLSGAQQSTVVDGMVARLNIVAPGDIPEVCFFVLRKCQPGEHAMATCKVGLKCCTENTQSLV